MGIQVSWDNEAHTVVRYDFDKEWKWEDWHAAEKAVGVMTADISHSVIGMIVAPSNISLPSNFLSKSMSVASRHNPLVENYVIVGASQFARMLLSAFNKMMVGRPDMMMANTVDEARAILAKRDGSQTNTGA
jgi:hypothetical protein